MQNLDYKQKFAISQSAIKTFKNKTLQKFKKIYIDKEEDDDEDQDKYAYGSLVDTIAFEPSLINERFYIPDEDIQIPGEKIKLIIDKCFKEVKEVVENKIKLNKQGNLPEPLRIPDVTDIFDWEQMLLKIARNLKYGGTTWTDQRIIDNIINDGKQYFRLLGISNNRSIITPRDNADAVEAVDILRKDKNVHAYFVQQENETLLFQTEIYMDYQVKEGLIVPLKGAIDIIRLNHNLETIRVPDLKTSYNSEGFNYQAKNYDYVYQASFYHFLVSEWLKSYQEGKYAHYKFEPPCNIVMDRNCKVPYLYEYDWEDIFIAQHGSEENNILGWKALLEEISWHIETGIWDRPRELYENGKIKLKIFKK